MTAITAVARGLSLPGKILGAVLLALILAAAAVIAGPGVARADGTASAVEYSSDGGVTWGGVEEIDWNRGELVPGRELTTTFQVRNASGQEGFVGFAVGEYTLTSGMIATARVNIDGKAGNPVTLTEARQVVPGTSVGSVHLASGAVAKIDLVVGMPSDAGNQAQSGHADPMWSVGFTPGTLPESGCVATGSLGSLGCMFGGSGSLAS